MKNQGIFETEYKKLNPAQKEAVDAIDGPVMVIAGPGTGKTQVLSLRIGNILRQTDTPPDGILCLTFTNSGVRAMRERLSRLIGPTATKITISTFHSFAHNLLGEFYEHIGLEAPPELLDERESVLLADRLLEEGEWSYLRPRSGGAHNFRDLKSLISFLKREGLSPEEFEAEVRSAIKAVEEDPESISSRGARKGELKSDALGKIERLNRSLEAARFYKEYEETKREANRADYDDILELATRLVAESAEARAAVAEQYLYVLVDEHQDSSGVQNKFLETVWSKVEKPNLFVVGDDRQLIYGFGGASLTHFESFREVFGGKLVTLTENYRSNQAILDVADLIFQSALAEAKLISHRKDNHKPRLVEAEFERDEIIRAGLEVKELIKQGLAPEECAILVPKNYQVKSAVLVLKDLGLPVAAGGKTSFFASPLTQSLIRALKVLAEPYNRAALAQFILDPYSGIPPLEAQKYLFDHGRKLSIEKLPWLEEIASGGAQDIYETIQRVAEKIFFTSETHETLLRSVEVVRTMLHVALSRIERNPRATLPEFISFIDRLEEYGEDLPLAVFAGEEGVKVMTLHGSKGLEFESVWIAHLDEKSLMKGKSAGFTLPEKLSRFAEKKSEEEARRELYVGITRAKSHCTLSYAKEGNAGGGRELSPIIAGLPQGTFDEAKAPETEKAILEADPLLYVASVEPREKGNSLEAVKKLVRDNFEKAPVSVTHLNNFLSCPWKWYFRNFIRLPEPESPSLLFGSFVHALVEESLSERRIPESFEEALDRLRIYDDKERARFIRDAEKVLETFAREILPTIAVNARSEFNLSTTEEKTGLIITGKVDLLEEEDGRVRITDFKTGQPKKSDDYLRQLAMYKYLIESSRLKFDMLENRLVFLEAKKKSDLIFEAEIGEDEVKRLLEEVSLYYKSLKDGSWTEMECHFKPTQFERECSYCRLKERLFE